MKQALQSIIANLLALFGTDALDDAWRMEAGFPKVKEINGVHFMLAEPLAPDYEPSLAERMFGAQANTYVGDPSNGDGSAKFPRRTPAGYPLVYGIDRDPKTGASVPSSKIPARVKFADSTYDDDADLARGRELDTARKQALGQYHPGYTGPVPYGDLSDADWQFYLRHPEVWGYIGGPTLEVVDAIAKAKNRLLALPFDDKGYQGILRAYART